MDTEIPAIMLAVSLVALGGTFFKKYYLGEGTHAFHEPMWGVEDSIKESVVPFHLMAQTEVIGCDDKRLYPPGFLTCPQ